MVDICVAVAVSVVTTVVGIIIITVCICVCVSVTAIVWVRTIVSVTTCPEMVAVSSCVSTIVDNLPVC